MITLKLTAADIEDVQDFDSLNKENKDAHTYILIHPDQLELCCQTYSEAVRKTPNMRNVPGFFNNLLNWLLNRYQQQTEMLEKSKEFEVTIEEMAQILKAGEPSAFETDGGAARALHINGLWRELGDKYGFDFETVRQIKGKDFRFFTAVPV